jgi:hypothetical protein
MNITIVPREHLYEVLPYITCFVKKASEWTLGRMSTADILGSMFNPAVTTWILFDDRNITYGYLTTQIIDYPQARHMAMLDECVDLVFDTFEQYARDSGCDGLEITGRPAWWKHIKDRGYAQPQRQYFKDLKGE